MALYELMCRVRRCKTRAFQLRCSANGLPGGAEVASSNLVVPDSLIVRDDRTAHFAEGAVATSLLLEFDSYAVHDA